MALGYIISYVYRGLFVWCLHAATMSISTCVRVIMAVCVWVCVCVCGCVCGCGVCMVVFCVVVWCVLVLWCGGVCVCVCVCVFTTLQWKGIHHNHPTALFISTQPFMGSVSQMAQIYSAVKRT